MSWLKKKIKTVKRSFRRMAKGRFHLNPLKNGHHCLSDPIGNFGYHLLGKHYQHKIKRAIDWGRFKKRLFKKLNRGNNSAYSFSYSGDAPQNGYQYSGHSISELM